eukprot:1194421-Prorocentrum_minimum.AAC.13
MDSQAGGEDQGWLDAKLEEAEAAAAIWAGFGHPLEGTEPGHPGTEPRYPSTGPGPPSTAAAPRLVTTASEVRY